MNRYTDIKTSQFNPLSLNEIMMVPLGKQKQHEQQAQQLTDMGIYDVNRLGSDDSFIRGEVERMKGKSSALEDELLSTGTSKNMAKKMMGIKRERDTFLSNDGAGGRAQNAYNGYQANVKALNSNKGLSQRQRDLGLQYALEQYEGSGGAEEGSGYNSYQGADSVNIEELAAKRAGEMTTQEITQITGWTQNKNGTWTNGTETRETLPREHIARAVMNSMSNDVGVQNYLQDAQKIGMINDPTKMLQNAAMNSADRFQVNNSTDKQDMKFSPQWMMESKGTGVTPSGMDWNLVSSPGDVRERPSESTLSMISRGATHSIPLKPGYDKGRNEAARKLWEEEYGDKKDGVAYGMDDLSKEEITRYEEIAKGLKRNGRTESTDLNDPAVQLALNDYDQKYGNYTYNVKIISDTSGGVGNYSSGSISKDTAAVLRQTQSDKFNQLFMHPKTGEVYNWEQMQSEFGAQDVDLVQGYVDVDNNLASNLDNQSRYADRRGEFASPMAVTLVDKDGQQIPNFYMTRNQGQMNRPRYKADMKLNKFFGASRSTPEIPVKLTFGDKTFDSSYLPEATIHEILNTMSKDLLDEQGLPRADADPIQYGQYVQLSNAMQEAGSRNGVYMLEKTDGSTIVNYKTKEEIQAQQYKSAGLQDFQ